MPNITTSKDKFGYYIVGDFPPGVVTQTYDLKTYSKFEAIELSQYGNKSIRWIFNDTKFNKFNWLAEPKETLDELYRRRAQQIRDNYDHIVIFYSGGADSGNVLESFVNNGIPFEEVATYNYMKLDPDNVYFHAEQYNVSYPKIKQLQDQGVNFLHRPIDLTDIANDIIHDTRWNLQRSYYGNTHWGTTHLAKTMIREKVEDYRKIIESGKKLVFVWGCEKPRVVFEKDHYYFKFIDIIDNGPGVGVQMNNRDWEHDELFYYTPDMPEIPCKQGHIIMNYFKLHRSLAIGHVEKDIDTKLPDLPEINAMFAGNKTEDGLTYRKLINWLIYPNFKFEMFTVGKNPGSYLYSLRDNKWNHDTIFRQQMDLIRSHITTIPPKWWRDRNDASKGLRYMLSKGYRLG